MPESLLVIVKCISFISKSTLNNQNYEKDSIDFSFDRHFYEFM